METLVKRSTKDSFGNLETFLSGMETGQAPSPRQGLNSLETFLSGMETLTNELVSHGLKVP